jgi:hypothetical protein
VKHAKKQFGRSMRHKDVRRCSIGAFAFYLLFRFQKSGEFDDGKRPDLSKNDKWFDIKILTDGTTGGTTKMLQKRTYTESIKKIFKKLQIVAAHLGHWGRVSGPVELEFEEVSPEYIRILGECSFVFDCRFRFHSLTLFYFLHYRKLGPQDPGRTIFLQDAYSCPAITRRLFFRGALFAPQVPCRAPREPKEADLPIH